VLVDLPALSSALNHNGGALQFGSDGKLYVGVGDNANGAQAPDLSLVFGKLLRFNDDGSIPGDNPICGTPGVLACAIWARGLRNPFTFAFQAGTGRMHINDVGQNSWEEIDFGAPAADYGWPGSEGPTSASGITAPIFAYQHSDTSPSGSGPGGFFTGCAIIGGAFYPDSGNFPAAYRGSYYFADLCNPFSPASTGQRQRRLCLRPGAGHAGGPAGRPRRCAVRVDADGYRSVQRAVRRLAEDHEITPARLATARS
jgi:glucose/arabinose dehydrogenase